MMIMYIFAAKKTSWHKRAKPGPNRVKAKASSEKLISLLITSTIVKKKIQNFYFEERKFVSAFRNILPVVGPAVVHNVYVLDY